MVNRELLQAEHKGLTSWIGNEMQLLPNRHDAYIFHLSGVLCTVPEIYVVE